MTPITKVLEQILPQKLAVTGVVLIYSVMLFCTLSLIGYRNTEPAVYLDVNEADKE